MKKKSLITSLVLGALLTLSLGVYTLVSAIIALTTPHHYTVSLAYTSEQKIEAFANYSEEKGNLSFTYDNDSPILDYNKEGNYYTLKANVFDDAAAVGASVHFVAVAKTDKFGSTTKYDVKVYKQGTGNAADDAYLIGNADGLTTFADKYAEDSTGLDFVELVHDVDLQGVDFKGIASVADPFDGTFEGNGYAVNNMTINIDKDNVLEFAGKAADDETTFTISAGLFNRTSGAVINAVSLDNAKINVNPDIESVITQTTVRVNDEELPVGAVRFGLVVGTSSQTTINGKIETENPEVVDNSKVNGEIAGYTYLNSASGMGGIAGVIVLADDTTDGVNNYDVNVKITNGSVSEKYALVGGVAGYIAGTNAGVVSVKDVNAILNTDVKFNMQNRVGGIAARTSYAKVENANVNVTVKDTNTTTAEFVEWKNDNNDFTDILSVGGVVAFAQNSSFTNVKVNITNTAYGYNGGAFATLKDSSATNVTVAGTIVGYTADGFAYEVSNSTVTYQAEANEEVVAANVDLTAYFADGLVGTLHDSNLTAQGEGTVKVAVNIHPYGSEITNINLTDTANSAGLVGYFYVTDGAASDNYTLSGFNVEVNVENGVNMAGLVSYLGSQEVAKTVTVENNTVVANFASHSTRTYSNASAHKVAGAVDTIYANAIVSNNDVTINMNKDASADNYGFAMFGGLVARIAGTNVTISGNTVTGEAYANNSVYAKTFNIGTTENPTNVTYKQITAGGLVGVIAKITDNVIEVGGHTYKDGDNSILPIDQIAQLNVSTITISNNVVDVDITISYKETASMNLSGYRARSVGSLIGLVMNTGNGTDSNPYTYIDLSSNTAAGTVTSDDKTFTYKIKVINADSIESFVELLSNGYGQADNKNEEAYAVGASFDYSTRSGSYVDGWNINDVATEIAE